VTGGLVFELLELDARALPGGKRAGKARPQGRRAGAEAVKRRVIRKRR
jgi:ribonuclease R